MYWNIVTVSAVQELTKLVWQPCSVHTHQEYASHSASMTVDVKELRQGICTDERGSCTDYRPILRFIR